MSYLIQLPDGRRARFPDTIPLEQAQQIVRRDFPDLFPKQGGVAGAFKKGAESLVSSAVAGATGIVDPEQAAREALEREQGIAQRYKDETSLDALKERYQKEGLFAAGKELVRQVPLAVAEQLPQAGVSLGGAFAGARLGAMAGSVAGPVGTGVGAVVGGVAGTYAPSWLQQFGTNLSRQAAEGKTIDASSAAAAAAVQAGIETAAGAFILGKQMVGKILGRPAEKALDSTAGRALAEQSLKRTLATGAVRATAVEVPTEVTQAMLERLQAGLPLTSDDALKEYGDTAYKTALSAPVFGGAARVGERGAARTQVAEEQKQETLRKQQEEQSRTAQEQDFVERQRRAQEAGVPLFAADRQALDLAEAAVMGPQMAAPPKQVDRSQEIKELQQDYARVTRGIEDIQKQIAQTKDVDVVAALGKQLAPLIQGRKQIEEQLATVGTVADPQEKIKEIDSQEAKLFKNMQKQAELGESQKAAEIAEKIKALRAERQQLETQVPQVGGEELFMETPAGFVYPEATRRAERVAEEVDTGYQAELPPVKTAETLEGRMAERQEKMRVEEARAAEEQARRDVKQLAKLMMGTAETEDIALQRVERSLDSPVSLRALGLTKPEERTQYADAVRKGELSPLVKKLLKLQSIDQIEDRIAQERERLQGYLAENKQLVTPDNTFTPDGMEAFATQVRINELNALKRNQPEQRVEDLGVPAGELLVRGDDALRIAKLQKERDVAVKQSQEAKAALDALTAQPEANEEQLAAAQQRYDTTLRTVTQRDTEIEQIKAKVKIGGPKAREAIKEAQGRQDQEFGNFASALDELRQTKLGQTERGYRYYVASMAEEATARGQEYMMPTFEQFKKDSLAKRKEALQQAVTYRNNYIIATIDEIDATRRAEGVSGVGAAERNALTKQLANKMDELMIRAQEYDPVTRKVSEVLVEPAVMRQGKVIRSARYEKVVEEIRRPQELPRFTPSKNITREQLAADTKAGTQAARPFARALFVTQEELAEIRDKALAREARPARSFIPGEQFTLPGVEPAPRKVAPVAEEKEEEIPEGGIPEGQLELFSPERVEQEAKRTLPELQKELKQIEGSLKGKKMPLAQFGAQYASAQRRTKEIKAEIARLEKAPAALRQDRKEREAELQDMLAGKKPMKYVLLELGTTRASPANFQRLLSSIRLKTPPVQQAQAAVTNVVKPSPEFQAIVDELAALQVQLGMIDQSTSAAQAAVTYSTFAQRQAALNSIAKILKEDAAKFAESVEAAKVDVSTMSAQMLTRDFAIERMQAIDTQLKETKTEINDVVTKINELTKEQDQGRAASMADGIQEQINTLSDKLADLYTVKSYFEYVAPSKAGALTAWLNTFKALSKAQNTLFNLQNDNGRAQIVEVLNQRKRQLEQRRDMLLFKPDDEKTVKAKEKIAFAQDNYDDVSKRFKSLETYIDGFEERKNAALAPLKEQLAKERDRIKQYEKLPAAYKTELNTAYRDADKIVQQTVNTINKLEADLAKAQLDFDRTTDERNISAAQLAKAVETLYKDARTYMRYDSRTGAVEVIKSGSAAPTSGEIDARIDRANREFARGKQMLETTKKLDETRKALDAEREQLAAIQIGLNLPGTKVERKAVVIETDEEAGEETLELKKKYDREVKNIRSQLSKLKKQVEKGEQDKVGPATSKTAALYGKMEALRQDLAKLQDQPVQRLDVRPITAAPFDLEAYEKVELGRVQERIEKEKQEYAQRIQDIDKQIAEAKGVQRAQLGKKKKLLLKQKEIFENTGGNVDLQALELAEAFENARMGTVLADKSIPRISEEQLAAQIGVYKADIAAIDKSLAAKGKKTRIEGPLRDTLITAKDNRLEAIKEIQTLINASNERIATIIDESFNKPKGTPKTRATEAAKLQYEIDAMSYSAPAVKKAAKDYGFKSAEYARALRDARRNAMARMSELENVPQAQSVRAYFERKGILKSRGQVENPTTVAQVRKVIQGAFPLVTDWDNKNVYVYPDVKSLGKNIGEYYNVPTDARGFVTPYGEVYLIASNIPKGQELAVFLHEVGAHVGFRNMLGDAQYKALVNQVETWAKRDDGSQESKIAKAAMQRVEYAFVGETPDVETRDDEILAYFVEEAVIAGVNPTEKGKGPVAGFLYRLYENFKKIIGKLLGPDFAKEIKNMTAQDFVDFAYGAADFELRGEWHGAGITFQEFDHSYMGTGEGMQAYMWGTYTSRAKRTGFQYALDRLNEKNLDEPPSNFRQVAKYKGKTIGEWVDEENDISEKIREARGVSKTAVASLYKEVEEAAFAITMLSSFNKTLMFYGYRGDVINAIKNKDYAKIFDVLRGTFEVKVEADISNEDPDVSYIGELHSDFLKKVTLNDFDFTKVEMRERPTAYLKRVISERGQDEYWELEKPLSEQSKHVQQSFDALLNDLASPEDAALLKEQLEKDNDRFTAANLFPAYLYAKSRTTYSGLGVPRRSKDGKILAISVADDKVPADQLVGLQQKYFKEVLQNSEKIPRSSEIHKATAELLWSYGIAGNKHRGAKADNYVNFYDKQQQILTTAEVSDLKAGVKDVLGTKGPTRKLLLSVNYPANVPESIVKIAKKVVAAPPGVFDKVKANNSWLAIRTQFIDRFEPMERVAAEMEDSLKATQMMYYLRMFDQRMSFTSEVTNNGALVLDKQKRADGKEEIVVRSGGTTSLKDVATELGKATSLNADAANMLFTTYLAALRADRVGLDTLNFNPDLTQKDLDEVKAYVERTPDVKAAFTAARTKYNEYNKGLINFLVQTGTLSKESGKKLSDTNDYIPFYRKQGGNAELVLGGEISPINVGSLKSQPYLNELVGDNRHILDFFTSSVQNTNLLTDMALRNLATRNVAFGLGEMGLLSRTDKEIAANKSGIRKGKDVKGAEVIRFKIDGEDYYAEADTETLGIPSDLLVKGLEGISMTVPAAVRMLGIPAQILRKFITRNPVYALRQIIRDSTAAVMVSGANMTPVASSLKELAKMRQGKSEGEKVLQERGILGGQVLTGTPEDISKILKELVDGGKGWTIAMAKLDNLAVQGDASTRVVMYNDFRKQGLSDMEATLATLESMNFNRRGLSPSVFMLSMMVPFMNAQIQGMDVLYRAFAGKMPFNERIKVREKLISRGLMLAGITLAYAAMMEDDETYKNADPADRYNNFFVHTPFFDEAVRVPIPFEIGYIFKALPEMVYNTAFGDTELKQIAPAIRKILSSLVPGDIPAGIKPMIELMTNYSFYSGNVIESEREQALVPAERYRAGTTEVSKAIGGLFGVSPIKLDYMIRGYTGGLGVALASIANPVLATNEKVTPEMRASETPIVGGLFQPKDAQGLINYAYDLVTDIEQKQRTMKTMQERGRPEDVKAFIEENRQDLKLADTAGSFKRFMGELAKLERNVRERTDMTPQQKREKLDEIRQRRIKTAQRMVSLVGESKRQASR